MNGFDRELIEAAAIEYSIEAGLIEKEWHAINALAVGLNVAVPGVQPVFCGGTSLSAAFALTARFSEDVDLKLLPSTELPPEQMPARVRAFRDELEAAMRKAGYTPVAAYAKTNEEFNYHRLGFQYRPAFPPSSTMRDHIQIEITPYDGEQNPVLKDVRTAVTRATKGVPDLERVACVDLLDTASDKLSALTWRVRSRRRGTSNDDPRIIRHLYDLWALAPHVTAAPGVRRLCISKLQKDAKRARHGTPIDPAFAVDDAKEGAKRLRQDKLYKREYDNFMRDMVYQTDRPTFAKALTRLDEIIGRLN